MARGFFHTVGGAQAREAEKRGFVKVDRATARRFYESGQSVIVTGSRVPPEHFLSGYKLAFVLEQSGRGVGAGSGTGGQLLGRGSGQDRAMALASARSRSKPSDFDTLMSDLERRMERGPYGRVVTFVLRKEFPRMLKVR
jgi:hypothetical protein